MASRREHLEIRNEGIIVALELDGVTGGPNYIEVDENQKLKRGCGDPALQDTCKRYYTSCRVQSQLYKSINIF